MRTAIMQKRILTMTFNATIKLQRLIWYKSELHYYQSYFNESNFNEPYVFYLSRCSNYKTNRQPLNVIGNEVQFTKQTLHLFVVNTDYMGIFWNKCSERILLCGPRLSKGGRIWMLELVWYTTCQFVVQTVSRRFNTDCRAGAGQK